MKNDLAWLKNKILDYIRTHKGADRPQIVSYMNIRCDFTLTALNELEEDGRLERYWNDRYYEVRLIK